MYIITKIEFIFSGKHLNVVKPINPTICENEKNEYYPRNISDFLSSN